LIALINILINVAPDSIVRMQISLALDSLAPI